MMCRLIVCGLLVVAFAGSFQSAFAQAEKTEAPAGADMEAMMKEWAKWANPSPMHKHLEKLAGSWSVQSKMWMDPTQPPMESKGTATSTLVLEGRWLQQEYKGDMMGMPFSGIGMLGYDNFKQQFIGTWVDNASTAMMQSSGTCNEAGTEFNLSGKMDEPMTGERGKTFRHVWKISSADSHVFEAYDNIPGKGEVKVLEITYTRVK